MSEQEQFESWAIENGYRVVKTLEGNYKDASTDGAWDAWNARAQQQCSSLCAKGEPCYITENGECDAQQPVVPTMDDAIAAGDGTLHGAIDYWQDRALKAEAMLSAAPAPKPAQPVVPEPDITKCPNCGGVADNGHDRNIPPNPYWCSSCTKESGLDECISQSGHQGCYRVRCQLGKKCAATAQEKPE